MRPPPGSGSPGASIAMPAKRLKKLSRGPNTIDGRRITAFGNAALRPASPSALLRAYLLGEFASAPMADT